MIFFILYKIISKTQKRNRFENQIHVSLQETGHNRPLISKKRTRRMAENNENFVKYL